jgi:hypothetical protein
LSPELISFSRNRRAFTDSGEPLQKAGELEHQHQPDDGVIQQRSNTGAVRQDDVLLQKSALGRWNPGLREQTEPGVDSVGGRIAGRELAGRRMGVANRPKRGSWILTGTGSL